MEMEMNRFLGDEKKFEHSPRTSLRERERGVGTGERGGGQRKAEEGGRRSSISEAREPEGERSGEKRVAESFRFTGHYFFHSR